jgi:hypothetical protein
MMERELKHGRGHFVVAYRLHREAEVARKNPARVPAIEATTKASDTMRNQSPI